MSNKFLQIFIKLLNHNFLVVLFTLIIALSTNINSQNFVKVSDFNNPITSIRVHDYFTGAAWVDYNGDNNLDLFLINRTPGRQTRKNILFKNEGNGNFSFVFNDPLVGDLGYWFGCTWADYDNDGDIDCHIAGLPSRLYSNNGDGTFKSILQAPIYSSTATGTSSSWADYDNDGNLDLILVRPNWLAGPPSVGNPTGPQLFRNLGHSNNYSFKKITDANLIDSPDTYMNPSWYDYDDDGDVDLFISRGAGKGMPEFLFRNLLGETGSATFERITTDPIATDLVEAQHWNWIDVDNDGDLDAFFTNWANAGPPFVPKANSLYINNNGSFQRITNDPITTDAEPSVGHIWGDYDNDGDIDCIVATDSTYAVSYYKNNGDGSFQKSNDQELAKTIIHHSCLTAGDYDNDGDLDLFVVGGPKENSVLLRNESNKNWVKFKLEGTKSNRTGIGAKVRIKADINGKSIWQRRDLATSNSFFGETSLNIHFGLGDATLIDSLKIEWPSGVVDVHTNVEINKFYDIVEESGIDQITSIKKIDKTVPNNYELNQNYPNPFNPSTFITYSLPNNNRVNLTIYDSLGKKIKTLVNSEQNAGKYEISFNAENLSSGTYFYQLKTNDYTETKKMIFLK